MHAGTSFGSPSGVVAIIVTITRFAPVTRSIAPPTPSALPPGIIQVAMSPVSDTSSAPSTTVSTWPPRIIANDDAESKAAAPGIKVTGFLPASISSRSTSPSAGRGPTPSRPFSVCRKILTSGSRKPGIRLGMPMPRFTTSPEWSSCAARAAITSRASLMRRLPGRRPARACSARGDSRRGAACGRPRVRSRRRAGSLRPRRS